MTSPVPIALAAAAACALAASPALACSCSPFASAADQAERADLIFRGRALSTRPTRETFDGANPVLSLLSWTFARETSFELVEPFKGEGDGNEPGVIHVLHYTDQMCGGVQFQGGATHLIFAYRNAEGRYGTDFCMLPQFPEGDYRAALGLAGAREERREDIR